MNEICPGREVVYRDFDGPENGESRCNLPVGHEGRCRDADGWWFRPMNPLEVQQ